MYTVYVSEVITDVMKSFECDDMNAAIQLCVDLYRKGHRIHKVVLPSGVAMYQKQIEGAIRAGLKGSDEAAGK